MRRCDIQAESCMRSVRLFGTSLLPYRPLISHTFQETCLLLTQAPLSVPAACLDSSSWEQEPGTAKAGLRLARESKLVSRIF